jgi:hypothetical protein
MQSCYNLISQSSYIFQAMTVHHQAVSCRTQASRYNVCPRMYGVMVNHQCVLYKSWSSYTVVETPLW